MTNVNNLCHNTFEWDINKNKSNIEKHGIAFEDASRVFDDDNALTKFSRLIGNEERIQINWYNIKYCSCNSSLY